MQLMHGINTNLSSVLVFRFQLIVSLAKIKLISDRSENVIPSIV